MPHPLDADEFTVPLRLPEVSMFWTLEQICQILGVNRGWIKNNAVGMRGGGKRDRRKLIVTDLTPDQDTPTYRVRHNELKRFLSMRNIPYK